MGIGGRSGPAPKPTAMLAASGSPYAAKTRKNEPQPRAERPKTDVKLAKHERRVFENICSRLLDLNVLGHTDGNAIARYAKLLCQYNHVCSQLAEHGETTVSDDGKVQRTPCSVVRIQLEGVIVNLEKQFGLTPSARVGLETAVKPAESAGIRGLVG